ncbi:MAG TPA: T9SS type A sorting domain-containing protein [Candidatus Kapabacteria bacterium]
MTYRTIFFLLFVCAAFSLSAQTWEPLGPYGPRTVYKVAESDSAILMLCLEASNSGETNSDVYRSEDKGLSWESTPFPNGKILWPLSNIVCIKNVFYAISKHSDFFMSLDHGRTWIMRSDIYDKDWKFETSSILDINNSLYVGWGNKYYNSNDSGLTWFFEKAEVDGEIIKSFVIKDNIIDNIVTVTKSGVYLSNDRAGSWKTITPIFQPDDYDGRDLAVLGKTIYVSTHRRVYYSTNMGDSWGVSNEFAQGKTHIRIAGYASRLWIASDSSVFYTSDNFVSVHTVATPQNWRFTWTLVPTRNGLLLSAYEGGAYLTFDTAKTWMLIEDGFTPRVVYNLWANDNVLFGGTSTGLLMRSTNNGNSWERSFQSTSVSPYRSQFNAMFTLDDSLYTAINEGDQIIASNDYGASWHINGREKPWTGVSDIAVDDSVWIALAGSPVRSDDIGTTWAYMNRQSSLELQQLMFHGGLFYAASAKGYIYKAIPTALNFERDTNDLPLSPYYAIASNGSTLFVGGDSGNVYRSRDSGTSWQKMNLPASFSIRDIKCYGSNVIILAPIGGCRIYFSPNECDTIITISPENYNGYASGEVAINSKYVFLQTVDKGIFRYNYSTLNSVRRESAQNSLTLYPNPAQTVVNIEAPDKANAIVHLFDMLGREVRSGKLSDEGKLTLEVSDLTNGIYTAMLEHNGTTSFAGKTVVAK